MAYSHTHIHIYTHTLFTHANTLIISLYKTIIIIVTNHNGCFYKSNSANNNASPISNMDSKQHFFRIIIDNVEIDIDERWVFWTNLADIDFHSIDKNQLSVVASPHAPRDILYLLQVYCMIHPLANHNQKKRKEEKLNNYCNWDGPISNMRWMVATAYVCICISNIRYVVMLTNH